MRCGACVGRVPPSVVPGRWGVAKKSSKQVQDGCSHHFSTTTGDTDGLGRLPEANLFSHYVRPKCLGERLYSIILPSGIVRNNSRYQQLLLNTRRLQQLTLGRFARKWVALPMGGIRAGVQAAGRMGDGVGAGRAVYILAG